MKIITTTLITIAMLCPLLSGCIGNKKNSELNTALDKDNVSTEPQGNENEPIKQEPTMQTTPSGLKYIILQEAPAGAQSPKPGQTVTVHYTGWLDDGTGNPDLTKKFDSSVDRREKFSFKIGMGYVIRGWDEGVLDMKVGEKRRLIIPADLGYGARGAGRTIPGGATLIFDVELFDAK